MMRRFLVIGVVVFAVQCHLMAMERHETTGTMRKVVFSGNTAPFPMVPNMGGALYVAIPIPEIRLNAMPITQIWTTDGLHPGLGNVFSEYQRPLVVEGHVWINIEAYIDGHWRAAHRGVVIVLWYNTGTELAVENPGTGKSLDLQWNTDDETAKKIRGYKVERREKE